MCTSKSALAVVAAFFAVEFSGMPLPAVAQDTYLGAREFRVSCAVCHGTTGKGDGEMASLLTVKPADLTVLARNNGGEFPFIRVFWVIDGRTAVSGHGDRIMPIWGDRYEAQIGAEPGTFGAEVLVNSRINDLVYFIGSIQEQ
jgi:mono/diheme cytochrome c family protein